MLFKSALVTHASGKIGGMVAAHNRGGLYLRGWGIPTNPNTFAQNMVRVALGFLAGRWGTLTDAQREGWRIYGLNVPTTNRLGDTIYLTGQQWYIACNTVQLRAGFGPVDDAPTTYYMDALSPVSVAATGASPNINVTFDTTDDWVDENGGALVVQVGIHVAPTINFFRGPFRYSENVLGDLATPPTSPQVITNPYGPMTSGNRVFCRIRSIRDDGRMSPAQIVSAIVA